MQSLMILPNFRIVVLVQEDDSMLKTISNYTKSIIANSQSETFELTASSFWKGMNVDNSFDFISYVKDNCEKIPANVLEELINWKNKFGSIILKSNNCLELKSSSLLKEIAKHSLLKDTVLEVKDSCVYFKQDQISFECLKNIFEEEFNTPIQITAKENIVEEKIDLEKELEAFMGEKQKKIAIEFLNTTENFLKILKRI